MGELDSHGSTADLLAFALELIFPLSDALLDLVEREFRFVRGRFPELCRFRRDLVRERDVLRSSRLDTGWRSRSLERGSAGWQRCDHDVVGLSEAVFVQVSGACRRGSERFVGIEAGAISRERCARFE